MLVSEFDFKLPEHLIAQYPPKNRGNSKLLVVNNQQLIDLQFGNLLDFIQPNDIIVRNNTKVIKARLFGTKTTGGKVEILVARVLSPTKILALIKTSKATKTNSKIIINDDFIFMVNGRDGQFFKLDLLNQPDILPLLQQFGHTPLPPYINRNADDLDHNRYQTIYAKVAGAVAAPTAGLHFNEAIISKITSQNIAIVDLTLHVGVGTFQPVRVANTSDHEMHSEWLHISQETVDKINQQRQLGGRVIAIGTTTLRALEAATNNGELTAQTSATNIFITPGFKFKIVDLLLTNFHLPKSTLLMLVSAFTGMSQIKSAYQYAINQQYRFFSYGDAMLLYRQ